jgi:carotenoid 1,2-hydratase
MPDDHCALNVALYSPGANRWTMTERGAGHVVRGHDHFRIGPSALHWHGGVLTIEIDEMASPLPRRVRGTVTVRPQGLCRYVAALDAAGRHRWGPIAPCADIEVRFDSPGLRWRGHAYVDSNEGDEPAAAAFDEWDWLRARTRDGKTIVVYDVRPLGGGADRLIAARFGADGSAEPFDPPARHALPPTGWRVRGHARGERPSAVARTLEDTPFYARSMLHGRLLGEDVVAMHETLDMRRLGSPWVQWMLPFRMPRRA